MVVQLVLLMFWDGGVRIFFEGGAELRRSRQANQSGLGAAFIARLKSVC